MQKKTPTISTERKWDGPVPNFDLNLDNVNCGEIDTNYLQQITDYTKFHHRSDDTLEQWSRFDKHATFNETQRADLIRLAVIDILHQRQFQRRAIAANVTDTYWNSIHPDYYHEYYSWMFPNHQQSPPSNAVQVADIMQPYPSTPITITDYGSSFSKDTMTRTRVENPTDSQLGFPQLLPLSYDVDPTMWTASIDRIPAHLFSRKISRRGYEIPGKAVIITNLPQLCELQAAQIAQNKRDVAQGKETTYKDIVVEGCEVLSSLLQDKPRTIEQIRINQQLREQHQIPTNEPHNCHYPLYFWTIPYLANLTTSDIHRINPSTLLAQTKNKQQLITTPAPEDDSKLPPPSHPYGDCTFRIGETDDGKTLRVRAKVYLQYLFTNKDDSPLYLFESNLLKSNLSSSIPKLFHPPTFLAADLVRDVLLASRAPPFQWFLLGAARSGTRMHLDPRNTSAWNCSTVGLKRWVIFRRGVFSNVAKGNVVMTDEEYEFRLQYGSPQCVYWFEHILPRLRRFIFHREQKRRALLQQLKNAGIYEFAPNGHALCTCNCINGQNRRADRLERLKKDYIPRLQDEVTFLCNCDCLCGCKLATMTACGINLNDIELKIDSNATVDDSFGSSSTMPKSLLDLEQKLENENCNQIDNDGLNIQQQIDLLLSKHLATSKGPLSTATPEWDELLHGYGYQEFIQYPHETIIVPSNMFHCVINVSDTIAITENYANCSNLHDVYRSMRIHNKSSTRRWLYGLEKHSNVDFRSTLSNETNFGRNIDEPMPPQQAASYYRRWRDLLREIDEFDNFKPISKYQPASKLKPSDETVTSCADVTPSPSTTDPEPWLSTDQDDM